MKITPSTHLVGAKGCMSIRYIFLKNRYMYCNYDSNLWMFNFSRGLFSDDLGGNEREEKRTCDSTTMIDDQLTIM